MRRTKTAFPVAFNISIVIGYKDVDGTVRAVEAHMHSYGAACSSPLMSRYTVSYWILTMFERFSESARQLMFFARLEAGRLGFDGIDTPHMVLAFLKVDTGIANGNPRQPSHTAFLQADTVERLVTRFSKLGPLGEPEPMDSDMPLTSRASSALANAVEHAGSRQVTPLHVLWAMLGDEQEDVASTIKELGITREQVDAEILRRSS